MMMMMMMSVSAEEGEQTSNDLCVSTLIVALSLRSTVEVRFT